MLRFYTAGESHGQALLAFISGLPAQMPVDVKFINHELRRRQLGYGRGGGQKIEKDSAEIFAGVRHGKTIGAPIALRIENRDWANWEKSLPGEAAEDSASTGRIFAQFSQSRFSIRKAIGAPMVFPWRTPAKISAASFSIFCRPPRP